MIAKQTPAQALAWLKTMVPRYYLPALDQAIRALKEEEARGVIHPPLES